MGDEAEKARVLGRRDARRVGDEAHPLGVVDVPAAEKHRRPRFGRLQQVAKRRDRAVVEEGRAEPDSVERGVGVAIRLAEGLEPLVAPVCVERVLVHRKVVRVIVQPRPIGAHLGDRRDLPHTLTREVAARGAVAGGAFARVDRGPRLGQRRVEGARKYVGEKRRRGREEPVGHAADRRSVEDRRQCAGAEGGGAVALVDLGVVAVPV